MRPKIEDAQIEEMILSYIRGVTPVTGVDNVGLLDSKLRRILDSMDVLELTAYLEASFGLEISDQDVVGRNFDTVRSVIDLVRRKLE